MHAMRLRAPGTALALEEVPTPVPGAGEILLAVRACAVCRTDLHIVDGELAAPRLPLVPGHEIVGEVVARGGAAGRFEIGDRVGVPWLAWACGECDFCRSSRENLCGSARFTGLHRDGGYAQFAVADERFALTLPASYPDAEAAPLLCAGVIGYRALSMAADARRLGLYGFGAAAHVIAQVAVAQGREVHAFTRPGDRAGQDFARRLGCCWSGDSSSPPPAALDAAIVFAPVGALVPLALAATRKAGAVICAGIHMSDIPSFPYALLWGERSVRSVANLTRADGAQFMKVAAQVAIHTSVHRYALEDANRALADLRRGAFEGAAVLIP
ncbi:MAG: zinc-dependent alcohol dehydrogenase family protein [Usitatibacter sp.]